MLQLSPACTPKNPGYLHILGGLQCSKHPLSKWWYEMFSVKWPRQYVIYMNASTTYINIASESFSALFCFFSVNHNLVQYLSWPKLTLYSADSPLFVPYWHSVERGRGLAFLKGGRKRRFCRRERDHTVSPANKGGAGEQHIGCMASLAAVDVMTPLVRNMETFVFCFLKYNKMNFCKTW